ncbi:CsbD family protein [Paraburkholderia sediminicola]|uniref:CsbD family protein n=1 Tax=Paraburkholderia sediminicola TaxID=458836 RepID=UPI0038B91614
MDTEKAEGAVREVVGKVQGAAGALVGDSATQLAGKARELSGKAQQVCADYMGLVRETAATKPLTTLAAVAAVSFVAGAIWRAKGSRRDDPRP